MAVHTPGPFEVVEGELGTTTTELMAYRLPIDCPRCGQRIPDISVPVLPTGRADRAFRYYTCPHKGCGARLAIKIDPHNSYQATVSVRRCDGL